MPKILYGLLGGISGEEPVCQGRRDVRDAGSIPGSGKSPEGGHGNPLQYSCLENPTDRGDCQAIVHRVEQSQTQLKSLSIDAHALMRGVIEPL